MVQYQHTSSHINVIIATVITSFKARDKEHQKKAIKKQTKKLAEICQNRTVGKDRFNDVFSVGQIEKC